MLIPDRDKGNDNEVNYSWKAAINTHTLEHTYFQQTILFRCKFRKSKLAPQSVDGIMTFLWYVQTYRYVYNGVQTART